MDASLDSQLLLHTPRSARRSSWSARSNHPTPTPTPQLCPPPQRSHSRVADEWAYRDGGRPGSAGAVPGTMLVATKGNDVIVHSKTALPESTTIHWHGIRLDNKMDG